MSAFSGAPSRRGLLLGAAALAAGRAGAATPKDATLGDAKPGASVRDAAGRDLAVPAQVARVFPAGPPAAILLYTLAPDLLLGWPRAPRPEERALLLPEIAARPEIGRLTGRGNTANLESVLALAPDLILDVGSTTETYMSLARRVEAQTGVPYALLDGALARTAETYRTLGRLLRREAAAEDRAAAAQAILDRVATRVATVPAERRPRVYAALGPRGLQTGRGGAINVESLEMVGARNVAAEARGGLATVSVEQVLAWDPDAIVANDAGFAAAVRTDPAWASLAAVRAGRVHLAPHLPFGWLESPPSVNRLLGLLWLGRCLYPDLFPEDLAAETRAFHARFYGRPIDAAEAARILAGQG
jgi:iron complex transport system substrate-binding protein